MTIATTEITWDTIKAARWQLVEHIRHAELEDVFIYESPDFGCQLRELRLIFADREAERRQDWQRICQAECGERVWYWPNK